MGFILKDDNSNGEPEDLAAMIDRLFQQGGGHLVINMDELNENVRFTTARGDCAEVGACAQPTEFINEDDENDLPLDGDFYEDDEYDPADDEDGFDGEYEDDDYNEEDDEDEEDD